jgi:ankyrin repeat protein
MNSTAKSILVRGLAFGGTFVFSLGVMHVLPGARQQRQKHFAESAIDGNLRRMQLLHLSGASVNPRDNSAKPLLLAAGEGKLEIVRYLLDEGADVDARDPLGGTALIEAAYFGHIDVVKDLLLRGADINLISEHGTALDVAVTRSNAAAADLLKHRGGKTAREIRSGG